MRTCTSSFLASFFLSLSFWPKFKAVSKCPRPGYWPGDRACCRFSWHLWRPQSTPPYLLPPTPPAASHRAESLHLDGGFRESLSRTKAGTGPVGPHLPVETNSTVPLQPSNLTSKCSFSGGLSGKESTCPCGRHGFDPRSGKIPTCHETTKPVPHNY